MAKPTVITFLLIRCGPTSWTEQDRIIGCADLPLSPAGNEAVAQSAAELSKGDVATIWCGPDQASRETADRVAGAIHAKIRVSKPLAGVDLGLWEGTLKKDLDERCPKAFRQWCEDPASVVPPEGEAFPAAQERVIVELCRILERSRPDHGSIGIVLHPLTMAMLKASIDGRPTRDIPAIIAESPPVEWLTVWRERLKELREAHFARAAGG